YHERYGHYPERVLADKIYRNRLNLAYCKERGIRLSGPALGRPKKDAVRDKRLEYKDNCDRVEVERAFSLAKRRFGLSQIRTYLKETTQSVIALSILALNLGKLQAIQCTPILFYLQLLLWKVKRALKWLPCQKVVFAQ
ncbi:Transposase DDE domain-containing protein, partial [Megasphaera paucivorans]